jgi:hypothetical protein
MILKLKVKSLFTKITNLYAHRINYKTPLELILHLKSTAKKSFFLIKITSPSPPAQQNSTSVDLRWLFDFKMI